MIYKMMIKCQYDGKFYPWYEMYIDVIDNGSVIDVYHDKTSPIYGNAIYLKDISPSDLNALIDSYGENNKLLKEDLFM